MPEYFRGVVLQMLTVHDGVDAAGQDLELASSSTKRFSKRAAMKSASTIALRASFSIGMTFRKSDQRVRTQAGHPRRGLAVSSSDALQRVMLFDVIFQVSNRASECGLISRYLLLFKHSPSDSICYAPVFGTCCF